jgi:sec-independent protein translocase protein TatC
MSFVDHLEELRWVLFRVLVAAVVIIIGVFLFKDFVFTQVYLAPKESHFITNRFFAYLADMFDMEILRINTTPLKIVNLKLAGQFYSHIIMSVTLGIVLTVPYIIYEAWKYIKPALYDTEKKKTSLAVFICSILFLIGVAFGYYVVVPLSLNFLGGYRVSDLVENTISLSSYINNISMISFALGFTFELPVVIYMLSVLGIATPAMLRSNRKVVYVILLVLSAIITPPDVVSQILVCIPLIVLYEISINISVAIIRKKRKKEMEEENMED